MQCYYMGQGFFCIRSVIGTSRFHTVKIFCAKKKDDRFDVNVIFII